MRRKEAAVASSLLDILFFLSLINTQQSDQTIADAFALMIEHDKRLQRQATLLRIMMQLHY